MEKREETVVPDQAAESPFEGHVHDARRLEQVCWHVLHNALKFSPPGQRVRVTGGHADSCAHLQVEDGGSGFAPAYLAVPFVRFAPGRAAGRGRGNAPASTLALGRGTWDGRGLTDVRVIFDTGEGGSASRIVFDRDGMIYMSSGNAAETPNAPPQEPDWSLNV